MPGKDVTVVEVQHDLPRRKLLATVLAIAFGTILEWYDYSIYTQLSKVLSKVFFPSNDPALQVLSFWGVYAVGFVSRPAGAVLFGHLGDTKGRGTCLLISVLVMGIPTVLIGCLPSYAQAGLAAPILMAVLRLVQGLAMGGEFGAAMVYLYELADKRHKGLTGSIGYISLGSGVVAGILMVTAVISLVPSEEAMLLWGWRVPFLAASVSLVAGIILRYNMPETVEFATNHEQMDNQYQARVLEHQQHHAHHQHPHGQQPTKAPGGVAEKGVVTPGSPAAAQAPGSPGAPAPGRHHYVPLLELFRGYWSGLLLHVCYAAWNAAAFHLGYSWLSSFFVQEVGVSTRLSLWMLLSCMVLFTLVVPVAGALSDRGLPRVTTNIVVAFVCGAIYVPTFMAFATRSVAACWALQALHLGLVGWAMGVLPAIVSRIYPAGVRISGFNLGHNVGAIIGGITPLAITAIQASTGATFMGPAVFMTLMALSSIVGSLLLIKFYPATNQAP